MRNKAKREGFTFIEIVLVVTIILIVIGFSTPLFKSPFRRMQFNNTRQELVQLMRYVQAKAIAERTTCRINFDFEGRRFWPTTEDPAHPGRFVRIKRSWAKVYQVPEGILLDTESSYITFYPDGGTDKAKIELSDGRAKTVTITTQTNIGYVQVQE